MVPSAVPITAHKLSALPQESKIENTEKDKMKSRVYELIAKPSSISISEL